MSCIETYKNVLEYQPNRNTLHSNMLRRLKRSSKSKNPYFVTDICMATDLTTMNTNQQPQGVIYVRSFKHYFPR